MTRGPRPWLLFAVLLVPLLLAALAWIGVGFLRQGGLAPFRVPNGGSTAAATDDASIARGAYLARIGNCGGCHTRRGGAPYAGGLGFDTPYGTVVSSNLTPDPHHGIGDWSLEEFRHAMRHGVSRNGVQSPVFPYANFALLADADVDALFAFLHTLAPVSAAVPVDELAFPANLPGAMAAWRLLYYRPARLRDVAAGQPDWQRGRYLVNGIGHCAICHGERGTMASLDEATRFAGGRLAHWYAPALDREALSRYPDGELARYLRGGTSAAASAYGAMADVVFHSLQYLTVDDATAIEEYLDSLPPRVARGPRGGRVLATPEQLVTGQRVYEERCADCHGDDGGGEAGKYPPLRDAVAVTAPDPVNAVNVILLGAVAPTTVLNPAPYSMPPFAHQLSAEEVAAVVNYMRQRWGRHERAVTPDDVRALGGAALR